MSAEKKITQNTKEQSESFVRKFPRKAYRKNLTFLCEGQASEGAGVEIGEGGLAFTSDREITKDKKLIINFYLLDKDFISAHATVVNISKSDEGKTVYGVSFTDISIALKRQIRAYVARTGQYY